MKRDPYYEGAERIVLGGVPCRVPNPPLSKEGRRKWINESKDTPAPLTKDERHDITIREHEAYLRAIGRLK